MLHYQYTGTAAYTTVTDPGFPIGGGANLVKGTPTPDMATFRKICMSKRKNWDPWGACAGCAPLLHNMGM